MSAQSYFDSVRQDLLNDLARGLNDDLALGIVLALENFLDARDALKREEQAQ